jgi:hypothetical protein
MKHRMDKTLRFWVDCSYEDKQHKNSNRTRGDLMAKILASSQFTDPPASPLD